MADYVAIPRGEWLDLADRFHAQLDGPSRLSARPNGSAARHTSAGGPAISWPT